VLYLSKRAYILPTAKMSIEFSLPGPIRDFVFDLHESMRRSQRVFDVQRLYDVRVKELTEKYFSQSPWPESNLISGEVKNDEGFLLFYK